MKKTAVVLLTLLVAIACIGLPLWLALAESKRQAFHAEGTRALGYARDIVIRADETGRQVRSGLGALVARHAAAPCAPASLALMRQIDLASSYLQAVGHVRADRMVCSSITGTSEAFDLGAPAFAGAGGALLRPHVRFPFAPGISFGVVQVGEFAAIIHDAIVIDTAKGEPDVSLALMSERSPVPLAARGHIDRGWLARMKGAREAVFLEDGHVIALVGSSQNQAVGIAAVPLSYLEARSDALALRLVPAGVLAGGVLTLAILFLARQQMALPSAVKTALRRKEFFLEYQPVVELPSGRWIGVEALVRWRRPTGEVVMPELFIPIAEQNGMIDRLTRQVLELVCRDTGFYLEAHPEFHIGINVAPSDFHSPGFLDSLQHTLERMGAHPSSIILEVTERGLLDPDVARETSGALRRHGFQIAIDDFGTGYSSLSYLESLELDYLKIDRSFIEAIGTGAPTSQVVGHIIRMARDLGLRMIAEGVESQAQADFLLEHGVQYAQGWLFGRSMAFVEIVGHMEQLAREEAAAESAAGA